MSGTPDIIGGMFGDVISLFALPGNTAGAAVAGFIRKRMDDARAIALDEFKKGHISTLEWVDEDELGGAFLRYCNAIRENAARLNLRLLAKVMVSQINNGRLFADEFNRYANMLSALSQDEVIAVALLHKATLEWAADADTEERKPSPWARVVPIAVPKHFPSEESLRATLCAALKSGLVLASAGWGELLFESSPLMTEVYALIDFQDALRSEGVL